MIDTTSTIANLIFVNLSILQRKNVHVVFKRLSLSLWNSKVIFSSIDHTPTQIVVLLIVFLIQFAKTIKTNEQYILN